MPMREDPGFVPQIVKTEPLQVPCIGVGAVSDDWAVELVSDIDGWRFGRWLSRIGDGAIQPMLAPGHQLKRFVTFDAALAFFRAEYATIALCPNGANAID